MATKKTVTKKKAVARKAPAKVETDTQRMIAVIDKAAQNPDVDPEKMKQLLDVQMTIMDRQAKIEFDQAMAECQAEMSDLRIIKNATNDQTSSNYAKHEQICAAIKPVYTKHGFRLSFTESKAEVESEYRITCVITHKKGHSESFWIDLPADIAGVKGTKNKTPVHAKGSTMSYGRRYLTLMVFDLATFDDTDGNIDIDDDVVAEQSPELPAYTDKMIREKTETWKDAFSRNVSSPDHVIDMISSKYTLTDKQKETIRGLAA